MRVNRRLCRDTSDEVQTIRELATLPSTLRVMVFATATGDDPMPQEYTPADGPMANLPVLRVLIEHELGYELFDRCDLTAQRENRYREIRDLLDILQARGRSWFSANRAPFTASLSPEDAASVLLAADLQPLTAESRPSFFALLSNLTEQEFKELNRMPA